MGLWERWYDPHGETIETCTILTTEANEVMLPLHGRMPVILDPTSDALWLDPGADATSLRALLVPYHPEKMESFSVNASTPRVERGVQGTTAGGMTPPGGQRFCVPTHCMKPALRVRAGRPLPVPLIAPSASAPVPGRVRSRPR